MLLFLADVSQVSLHTRSQSVFQEVDISDDTAVSCSRLNLAIVQEAARKVVIYQDCNSVL